MVFLSACSSGGQTELTAAPTSSTELTSSAEPTSSAESGGETTENIDPKDKISRTLSSAMEQMISQVQCDISGMTWEFGAENYLRNIYYAILSENPELKYAYDMQVTVSGDTATCNFSYMPYKTGAYDSQQPAGSHTVGSLRNAMIMAQSMIDGTEHLSIAITDPELSVEDIQLALRQAGYGWICFSLSRDGTEISAQPSAGKTIDECVEGINESFRLGGEILAEIVTADMTDSEKTEKLYSYVADNVTYDCRYYNNRGEMPFESTVALGALRDKLAICGGYSQAFQTLLDMSGIENYTVSGTCIGEYHMWNLIVLDGKAYYCDATADRGGMKNHFMLTGDELEAKGGYQWDREFYGRLLDNTAIFY